MSSVSVSVSVYWVNRIKQACYKLTKFSSINPVWFISAPCLLVLCYVCMNSTPSRGFVAVFSLRISVKYPTRLSWLSLFKASLNIFLLSRTHLTVLLCHFICAHVCVLILEQSTSWKDIHLHRIGLIQVKEEGWTGFSQRLAGLLQGISRGPAWGKPVHPDSFYFGLHSI